MRIDISCTVCGTSTSVTYHDRRKQLSDRGWRIDRGALVCKSHRSLEVMPRHRQLPRGRVA